MESGRELIDAYRYAACNDNISGTTKLINNRDCVAGCQLL